MLRSCMRSRALRCRSGSLLPSARKPQTRGCRDKLRCSPVLSLEPRSGNSIVTSSMMTPISYFGTNALFSRRPSCSRRLRHPSSSLKSSNARGCLHPAFSSSRKCAPPPPSSSSSDPLSLVADHLDQLVATLPPPQQPLVSIIPGRSVISVSGSDAAKLLHNLTTNDINHLCSPDLPCVTVTHPFDSLSASTLPPQSTTAAATTTTSSSCQYSLMLSPKGRVLLDLLVWKVCRDVGDAATVTPTLGRSPLPRIILQQQQQQKQQQQQQQQADGDSSPSSSLPPKHTFFLECDSRSVGDLLKHLRRYRLRMDVDVDDISESVKVWSLLSKPPAAADAAESLQSSCPPFVREHSTDNNSAGEGDGDGDGDGVGRADMLCMLSSDPRSSRLGHRAIASNALQPATVDPSQAVGPMVYHAFRRLFGVCEGQNEVPPDSPSPLEYNTDLLHGVSFDKGCYLGQELTARTHHVGVIRKRLFPLLVFPATTASTGTAPDATPSHPLPSAVVSAGLASLTDLLANTSTPPLSPSSTVDLPDDGSSIYVVEEGEPPSTPAASPESQPPPSSSSSSSPDPAVKRKQRRPRAAGTVVSAGVHVGGSVHPNSPPIVMAMLRLDHLHGKDGVMFQDKEGRTYVPIVPEWYSDHTHDQESS
eukprot:TRINITY_DN1899_c0_g1_i1.p1 TRINITY_DN1899_c0_g1~~TRINITY_DN1899_c0_g1_i1.p1  ORF type:complete len:647 (-),score=143.82 TRINITY_DN1899_c0_g1_i1:276-2216(-)